MAESNNRFAGGKMNKDFDERLVPSNEYRDALNVQTSTSDGSDVGTLQNLMGNVNLSESYFTKTDGFHCIGSIKDDKSNNIYWMISGDGVDILAEYDYTTGVVAPVVVDVYSINVLAGPGSGRVLNFDKNFLITGINIIEGFLFWTDNNTEPKQINIEKCKLGSPDFLTHTVFYVSNPQPSQSPPFVPVGDIKESHITVIKKSPLTAPKLVMKNTNRGDIDNDGTPGVIKSQINIDEPVTTLIDPNDSANWMPNQIAFETTSMADFKIGDFLELTPVGTDLVGLTSIIIEIKTPVVTGGGILSFNAEIVSGNVVVTQTSNLFDVALKQKPSLFEFKFPRFAYRYKYVDGQYSTFSPFSEVAFLPSEFDYLPKEGYNLGMVNTLRSLAVRDFVDKKLMPEDVVSVDILYKESNSPVIYTVETVKRVNITNKAGSDIFDSWNGIGVDQVSDTLSTTGFLDIKSELIHAVVPSNQLLRGWDNVPRKALAQEVIGNRVVYANYLQNYNMSSLRAQIRTAFQYYPELRRIERDNDITVDLKLSHVTNDVKSLDPELLNPGLAREYSPAKSIKTLRTYQLGVVYIDEFGRETPVFTSSKTGKNSTKISKETANLAGQLKAQVFSATPDFAKNFKFLIKESSNEYYNLAMDRWYPAQDGNIWLSFPSAERNKVDEETFLILKKGHNQDDAVLDDTRYKILAIDNEAPLFIKTRRVPRGSITSAPVSPAVIPAEYTLGVGLPTAYGMNVGFPQPGGTYISIEKTVIQFLVDKITETGLVDWQFRINNGLSSSAWYSLRSVVEDATDGYYEFTSKKTFGPDMNVSSTVPWTALTGVTGASTTLTVEFVKKEVRNLPEFDGRFFVKILKDSTIKKNVEGIPVVAGNQWVVKGSITSQYINPQTTYLNTWPSAGGIVKYYGVDPKRISISKLSNSAVNNSNAHAHSIHDNGNGVAGEVFWQNAGSTPYAASKSSGWFIDKIEAFRPFQMTGGSDGWNYGGNDDKSYVTNPASGWVWRGAFFNNEHPNSEKQLQLCGNNTYNNAGANTYLGNSSLKQHGTKLRDSSKAYGGIIPSVGIDATDNIIHLSFVGVGPESNSGNITSLNQLKTHFGEAVWAQSFVREQSFVDAITTPGTLWRWKEDPDGVINRTKGWDPSMASVTNAEWNKNSYDTEDGKNGISLYNYATFQDYPVRHKVTFTANIGPNGGALPLTAFVSQGVPNHTINSITSIGAVQALIAYTAFGGNAGDIMADLGNYDTSGGWGTLGVTSSAHFKYPCMTKDWGQPRNRRRRFMFAAAPFIAPLINNGDIIDQSLNIGLGATPTTGNYLPTNDPTTAPHFDDAGILLPSSIGVPRPATAAPGIRPDGMYSGYTDGTDTIPGIKTTTDGVDQSHIPGSVTWEIVEPYTESDDESTFTTTNPAIWETEPKENIDLDLYHEVGQIYPIKLDGPSMNQFVGPIRSSRALNTKVECWHPVDGWVLLNSGTGLPGADDIRVYSHDRPVDALGVEYGKDTHVWLQDVNGFPLTGNDDVMTNYPTHVIPTIGSRLMFTREDGSRTESTVKSQHPWMPPVPIPGTATIIPGSSHPAFELEDDTHNYEVVLPWFNCYSFGNGVESNRIRDDYNQVFIDKGAKVSTVLEEPYMEDKRSSGFIYSGIFNSTSNVNNLNQFIQAEKITKDLNPDGGSIQKLFARDTDLVTLCEDKIFKVLANKDALYNADGDSQLVSTNNVLGKATTFSGDYGISTNPESFASESFRMYFTDKARGAVLRLSRDGLTPISSAGMTDWFNDNLATSNRLIGSYDDKKKEYNLTLGFFNFNSFSVGILSLPVLPLSVPVDYTPKPPGVLVLNSSKANRFSVGDEVSGPGIPPNTVVTQKVNMGGGEWWLKLNNTPLKADMAALGSPVMYGPLPSGPGPHRPNDVVYMTRVTISTDKQPSQTLTWSESGKGWVSFKSFIQENGISINNDYFTFKKGMLYKHHANEVHNLFYDAKMPAESTVQVLFNEVPGSVKSFSTLNYEGSESHITQDITNSGEYWDNQGRLGWYVDNIYTDLQQGDRHEFKDKEGKWFSQIQGVTTEWLDDGKSGNLDSNEFSYQGVDETYGVEIITGGYTSWNCQAPQTRTAGPEGNSTANLTRGGAGIGNGGCIEIPGLGGTYATEVDCYADVNTYCGDPCQNLAVFDAQVNTQLGYYDDGLCIGGGAHLTVAMEPTATSWVVSYTPVDPVTLVSIGQEVVDPNLYTFSGDSAVTDLDAGSWLWTATDSNGCSLNNYFVVGCTPVYGCTNTLASNYDPLATVDDGSCVMPVLGCTDPLAFNYDPAATVDDGSCVASVYGCTDSTAQNYDPLANVDDGSCIASVYGCTDPTAVNYYAGANIDDGSCAYPVYGCTDQWATNYDPLATNDDGSCFGPCSGANWPSGFTFLGQPYGNTQLYFEQGLYANGVDNQNPNTGANLGKFRTKYACGVTHLSLNNYSICDLTGLEAFWDLETINLGNNGGLTNNDACELREIPTGTFPKLRELHANMNHLSQSGIDLSANPLLEVLDFEENQPGGNGTPSGHVPLTTLDLTNNPLLKKCFFRESTISDVDLSTNNGNLKQLGAQQAPNGTIINLGINVDLTTLNFSCGNTTNMTVKVGTVARANQGNALMLTGGSAPLGAAGHWSVLNANVTFIQ